MVDVTKKEQLGRSRAVERVRHRRHGGDRINFVLRKPRPQARDRTRASVNLSELVVLEVVEVQAEWRGPDKTVEVVVVLVIAVGTEAGSQKTIFPGLIAEGAVVKRLSFGFGDETKAGEVGESDRVGGGTRKPLVVPE